ncbi:DUF6443 domain-containing protein [Tenacibaculum skagerrakense]|nr:DUF6443 domain-containing protein [Tenacibaculum skagerrakense]
MKKLVFILLVLPFVMYAQSTNENHVVTKVYKKATTSPVSGHNKDEVMTSVQYFDGLGRLKQTVAVNAGGNTISNNTIPIDWTLGNTGPTDFFTAGTAAENRIINGSTPFGGTDLLWECIPDAASNFDGGWNTKNFTIDNTKTYRYSIWVKRTGSQAGTTYHGTQSVDNLDGTPNANPYFWAGDLPQLNTWYLLVGVVHPHTYRGSDTGVSGVYDTSGNKVKDGTEYRWRSDYNVTRLRDYLYYCTDTSVRQYFWSPLFQEIDGGELPLEDIFTENAPVIAQENIKDIVSHVEYDNLGRMTKEYLPVTNGSGDANIRTENMATATQDYYARKYAKDFAGATLLSEINAYSEKAYDFSPLNRVTEQAAPGLDWKLGNGHEIKFDYDVNAANEVKVYEVTTSFANNTYTPTLQGGTAYYLEGALSKTVTKDENWKVGQTYANDHTTEEFKNKSGQVILKRTYNQNQKHDTYYVYDDFGNLTYVIPPKAEGTVAKPTTTKLSELCYQYVYDYRNRLVEKKIPGKGKEYIVYDKLDRPILTQDTNLKAQSKWLYTKYDQLGRVIYTGYRTNSHLREDIQNSINSASTAQWSEERINSAMSLGGVSIYYTNRTLPTGMTEIFTVNYYDSYVDLPSSGLGNTVTNSYGVTSTTNTKGLATVTKTRVLGTNHWITTVTYYDKKARPIYVYSKNDYLQTTDVVESKLDDFTGKVLETRTTHTKTGKDPIVTIDRFEYDHMDRLISQNQQINGQISERIVKNNYDDLGQLESKILGNGTKVGYKDVTSGLSIADGVITKTSTVNGWNVGLATQGSFNADGYVEYIAPQHNKDFMVGLSNTNNDASFSSIRFALYNVGNGYVHIYEWGTYKGNFGRYYEGDIFRVERIGDQIQYKRNGETFYTSTSRSSGTLIGDVSIQTYNAKIKDFKIVDNSKGLQKVDYNYNVRGWLTNINDDVSNDNDLFNFSIQYNDPSVELNKRLYNGNIAQTSWQTQNVDNSRKTYNYTYDALNRITAAYGAKTTNYNLGHSTIPITYDKNGNIERLYRKGHTNADATTFGVMDDLHYTYNGNKLTKVLDNGNDNFGFKDGANTTVEYTYDANGNMLTDANKGVTAITYNHLNLPTSVTIGGQNISYTYDASGVKLSKTFGSITTEYAGNYVYEKRTGRGAGTQIHFFRTSEGYYNVGNIDANGDLLGYYVYEYKDHLGNVRLSFADANKDGVITASSEILEEKNYYPFGLQHKGYNNVVSPYGDHIAQRFSFVGKELNQEQGIEWHDFGARNYDASLGRWMNSDPLAEQMRRHSPYNYAFNNPIYFIDPDGMAPMDWYENQTTGEVEWFDGNKDVFGYNHLGYHHTETDTDGTRTKYNGDTKTKTVRGEVVKTFESSQKKEGFTFFGKTHTVSETLFQDKKVSSLGDEMHVKATREVSEGEEGIINLNTSTNIDEEGNVTSEAGVSLDIKIGKFKGSFSFEDASVKTKTKFGDSSFSFGIGINSDGRPKATLGAARNINGTDNKSSIKLVPGGNSLMFGLGIVATTVTGGAVAPILTLAF